MSTNPTSFRYPFESQIASLTPEVQQAHRFAYNGILDLTNAIASLKSQINTSNGVTSSSATTTSGTGSTTTETVTLGTGTTAGVTSFNSATGAVNYFPGMGYVNPQDGVTAYTTQSTNNGKMVVLNATSAIAVTLDSGFAPPWFVSFSNQGAGTATLTPSTGLINGGASITLPGGSWVTLYLDGTNWTADAPGSAAGGVTQLLAGTNVTLSPVNGTGVVTVNAATSSGLWTQNDVTTSRSFGATYTASTNNLTVQASATVPSSSQVGVNWNIQGFCGPTAGTMILVQSGSVSNAATGQPGVTFDVPYGYFYQVVLNDVGISPTPVMLKWIEISK